MSLTPLVSPQELLCFISIYVTTPGNIFSNSRRERGGWRWGVWSHQPPPMQTHRKTRQTSCGLRDAAAEAGVACWFAVGEATQLRFNNTLSNCWFCSLSYTVDNNHTKRRLKLCFTAPNKQNNVTGCMCHSQLLSRRARRNVFPCKDVLNLLHE